MPLFRCYQDTVHRTYVIELSDEAPVKHARAVAEGSATDRVGIEGKVIKEQSPTTSLGVGTSTRIPSNSSTTPRRFLMRPWSSWKSIRGKWEAHFNRAAFGALGTLA
jgi:hypothetical protein